MRRFQYGEMAMRCPKCGTDNPQDARFCNLCATPLYISPVGVPPHATAPTEPEKKSNLPLILVVVVVVCVIVAGIIWAISYTPKKADLTVTGFSYEWDYWSDTIHVWGTVVNEGNGWTDDWEHITIYVTVWFDHEPYAHTVWILDELGPGESQSWERTWDTPFTLDPYVSCYAKFDKITWYNA